MYLQSLYIMQLDKYLLFQPLHFLSKDFIVQYTNITNAKVSLEFIHKYWNTAFYTNENKQLALLFLLEKNNWFENLLPNKLQELTILESYFLALIKNGACLSIGGFTIFLNKRQFFDIDHLNLLLTSKNIFDLLFLKKELYSESFFSRTRAFAFWYLLVQERINFNKSLLGLTINFHNLLICWWLRYQIVLYFYQVSKLKH